MGQVMFFEVIPYWHYKGTCVKSKKINNKESTINMLFVIMGFGDFSAFGGFGQVYTLPCVGDKTLKTFAKSNLA